MAKDVGVDLAPGEVSGEERFAGGKIERFLEILVTVVLLPLALFFLTLLWLFSCCLRRTFTALLAHGGELHIAFIELVELKLQDLETGVCMFRLFSIKYCSRF